MANIDMKAMLADLERDAAADARTPRTKLVCTLGPASRSVPMLEKLLRAGMNVARFNFSHGTHEYHQETLDALRQAMHNTGILCAVMLDTKGPEIRTGFLKDGKPVKLTKGQEITVSTDYDIKGDSNTISMSYKKLPVDVKPGHVILCADGTISLTVISCDPEAGTVKCMCENTAMLGERKNCNLPGIVVDLPTLTEKDKEDIMEWGVPNDIDMIALSFVRKGSDLVTVRKLLGPHAKRIKLMSKVQIGPHVFTYDHVYGSTGPPSSLIFERCVHPLIDSLLCGYNTTVLAYGQTGSGKTYMMGTNYTGEANCGGIIPQVMETIFKKAESMKDDTEFLIRVSFIEIFKEEIFDLLDNPGSIAKAAAPARVPIQIRETANGSITLAGVTEAEVKSKEEMALHLAKGFSLRTTGTTNMNSQSSRSHAIFTISVEQKRTSSSTSEKSHYDILSSKFNLVDLAGSERAKRTGANGSRLKEGIHINRGLLALGNVISALGNEKKRKEGAFVQYRESKLTRLLQDSLGGNSRTVMIACISPADSNAEETINTLKYANHARNIQNKAVINRDPVTEEMQKLRSQLEQLQSELLFSRSGSAALEELQLLQQKVSLLELKNEELYCELKERKISCEQLVAQCAMAQLEKDQLMLKIESARKVKLWGDIENDGSEQDVGLMKTYMSNIQQLESEVTGQKFSTACRNGFHDRRALDKFKGTLLDALGSGCEVGTPEVLGEVDGEEKEPQDLDQRLQQKKKEIEDLRHTLTNISSSTDECAHKTKGNYLQKLSMLESQVCQLKTKQETQQQLLRQKQKSDDTAMRLQGETQRIKSQKVQLQQNIKKVSEQFRSWKAAREKEVLQLKKKGRRNEYAIHKLQALNQKQKMVLQQKTEEAIQFQQKIRQESEQFRSWKAAREKEVLQFKEERRRNEIKMHKLVALNQKQKLVLQQKTKEAAMATKRLKDFLEANKFTRDTYVTSGSGNQMFLENAMAEKDEAQEPKSRKPLADIGNTAVKQNRVNPKQNRADIPLASYREQSSYRRQGHQQGEHQLSCEVTVLVEKECHQEGEPHGVTSLPVIDEHVGVDLKTVRLPAITNKHRDRPPWR